MGIIARIDHVVPLRDQVVERTAGEAGPAQVHARLAEGHAAVHTPGTLLAPLLFGQRRMKFIKVLNAFQRCNGGIAPALILQKSGWFLPMTIPSSYCCWVQA